MKDSGKKSSAKGNQGNLEGKQGIFIDGERVDLLLTSDKRA
ncbi:hypothetical protein [Peribacillus frigoritolerans]